MSTTRWILTCKDWLRFCLTGEVGTDVSEAAVAPGDARARGRSMDMLRLFDLDASVELFPPVFTSESVGGHVTVTAAAETGLRVGTPVAVGAGDVPCCALASGAADPGMACTILGATLHNGLVVDRPLFEPLELGLLFTLPDQRWLRVMVNLAGTTNLDWALQTLFPEADAGSVFAKAEQMASSRPAGACGLTYHPYLSEVGLIAPVVARGVRAQFSGLRSTRDRADLMRAVYEGVVFALMSPATLLSIERAMKAFCLAMSSSDSPNITDHPRAQKNRSIDAKTMEDTGLALPDDDLTAVC